MDLFGDLPPPKTNNIQQEVLSTSKHTEDQCLKRKMMDENASEDPLKKKNKGYFFNLRGFVAERKGERDEMQDSHVVMDDCTNKFSTSPEISRIGFYAIFDGHAGSLASTFAADNLLNNIVKRFPEEFENFDREVKKCLVDSFKETDESFLQEASKASPVWKDGSTATCILIVNDVLYAASIGDSKAILVRDKGDQESSIISLSKDHSPTEYNERMRIQKAGGYVRDGRVLGILEVSRSFGDSRFKKYGVTAVPEITKCALSENDRYILLACDGLWKGFTTSDAVSFIDSAVKNSDKVDLADADTGKEEHIFARACASVANEAIRRGSSDNVSVILVPISREDKL